MKDQSQQRKWESNPIKLVWLLTLLSFSVGVFMIYIIWSTLIHIRNERENLFELQQNFISIQNRLETSLTNQKSELNNLLEARLNGDNQEEDIRFLNLIEEYRQTVSDQVLDPAFQELEKNFQSFISVKNKLTWWASAYNRIIPRLPGAHREVEAVLESIVETVDLAEGRQRLKRAAKIREIRQNQVHGSHQIDIKVLDELMAPIDFSIIRRDITDLVQLSDRLHIIAEADNLADLKDNKIRTLLGRVRLNTQLTEGEISTEKNELYELLDRYETAMFGQGYSIDDDHQTIILGYDGDYGLVLDQLRLNKEKKTLQQEADTLYNAIETSLEEVRRKTNTITRQEVVKVEKVLGQTWRTMVIIWIVTSVIYAMLAYEIIMAARSQIKAIEASNVDLEKMADELRNSEKRLHRLSSELFAVQENERKRISFELHDELGQAMAALKLQVGAVARRLGTAGTEELQASCQEMRDNINQIIENVRRLARDLSPVVLDDLGLQAAIEYLVNNFAKFYNVEVTYRPTDINHLFNEESQRNIYRILQEALTNIGKHARARHVSLVIEQEDNAVRFTVKDDGRGFNVQKVFDKKGEERGMGLEAMSERVRILGGRIDFVSRPGIETTVTFTAPIR